MLTSGPPPPAEPPIAEMDRRPVPTDPRPQIYGLDAEIPEGLLHLSWNAEDPEHLVAELRVPTSDRHVSPAAIARFWDAVRDRTRTLEGIQVEAADPRPPPRGPGSSAR